MPLLTVKAPAKINLHLKIGNLRPDGFHSLESLFAAVDFGDILHFEPCPPDGSLIIEMNALPHTFDAGQNPQEALPAAKNIIFRAVSLFRERSGFNMGLKIRLEKRIPLGGGLGGGSSDAAAALYALNSLAEGASVHGAAPLDADSLAELGAAVGSDVPFFLKKCGAAWVSGRGETVQPLKIPQGLWLVLVKPDFSSDTAAAYRLLDQHRMAADVSAASALAPPLNPQMAADALAAMPPHEWPFANDFLPVFLADAAVGAAYQKILGQLREQGAEFTSLSGAGSTCFGAFRDREKALSAYEALQNQWNFVKFTFLLEITDRAG